MEKAVKTAFSISLLTNKFILHLFILNMPYKAIVQLKTYQE